MADSEGGAKKTTWRQGLGLDIGSVSAPRAAVLGLHHIEIALGFMHCIDPDPEPADNLEFDNLERNIRDNEKRRRFMLAALDARYKESVGAQHLREVATAFINALIDGDNALAREDAGQ